MKTLLLPIIITLIFISASTTFAATNKSSIKNKVRIESNGGGTNEVRINNNVNTGNSQTLGESTSQTTVDINQEGNTTSTVTINGKEYKVEGTGSLHINEGPTDNSDNFPSPTSENSPTPTPDDSSEEMEEEKEKQNLIQRLVSEIKDRLQRLFDLF